MSPPVLGSLIALCVGMLLPQREGGTAFPPRHPSNQDLKDIVSVNLLHGKPGLTGIFLHRHARADHCPIDPKCGHEGCEHRFRRLEPTYLWRNADNTISCYHEMCVMLRCNKENAEIMTLKYVKEMLNGTDNSILLETLFAVEDDLTRMDCWEVDSVEGS